MDVFIANFGRGNYAWEECKRRPSIATMNDADHHQFWLDGDRKAYIDYSTKHKKTAMGNPPPPSLSSRWFNLMTIIQQSQGDTWIHRSGDEIWWTVTSDEPAEIDAEPRTVPYQELKVYECHKPCEPWSNHNKAGVRLTWSALHPKAKDFLATESTLQKLSESYAAYALALIDGADLAPWHDQPSWNAISEATKKSPVRNLSREEVAAYDMAYQAMQTTKQADGRTVERTVKVKKFGFVNEQDMATFLTLLLKEQENLCALTGLPLQFKNTCDDQKMLPSLDRIDSNGHYERGNLQIVCRFINFWKSDQDNGEFLRLIDIVRNSS